MWLVTVACWDCMEVPSGYVCECFFTENIYIRKYNVHVVFHSAETFYADNRAVRMISIPLAAKINSNFSVD